MKVVNWGIIGAGDVAEVKSGPAFSKSSQSELLAVMRRSADKARDFAARHNVPNWYSSADELLVNPDINAVYIATPPSSHKHYAIQAMRSGKHVYIEKPVTLTAAQCDELIAVSKETGMKASVAHYRRYNPSFIRVSDLVQGGEIGTPMLARIDMLLSSNTPLVAQPEECWRTNPSISGGGLFHDLAPHHLDFLLHLFGDVSCAGGFSTSTQGGTAVADYVQGWIKFVNGVSFQGRWHFDAPLGETRDVCEIIGTQGSVRINFFGEHIIQFKSGRRSQVFRLSNPQHAQQPMVEQVNAFFRGERDNPCSLEEAKESMRIMDMFTDSSKATVLAPLR